MWSFLTGMAGALVQWLKLYAWKVGVRGLVPHSGFQVKKKKKILRGDSVTEK